METQENKLVCNMTSVRTKLKMMCVRLKVKVITSILSESESFEHRSKNDHHNFRKKIYYVEWNF